MPAPDDLSAVVSSIPIGKVASYGVVGQALKNPASGYFVGRWMGYGADDMPWWRVVAKDGKMPVWKRNPNYERIQIERLQAEGVEFVDGKVDMVRFAVGVL